jgi:phospholipase C
MAPNDDTDRLRLRRLKHIVVVMMENRSFDHMLGSTTTSTRRGSRPGTSSPRATGPMEFECPR